jgi:hypothetical protein
MATSIDKPPIYDPITKDPKTHLPLNPLSDQWISWFTTFWETMQAYLSQNGVFISTITTAQRGAIQSPVNGQMIYNSDTGTFQGYQAGAWKTFTLS